MSLVVLAQLFYENKGTLPLGQNVISYLFDNMPFTADLINAYLGTNYTLEYTSKNRRYFNGSNGRSLSGAASSREKYMM